jgi:predicted DNA binding protein
MQWLENDESFEITSIIEQVPGYSLISVKAHGTIAMLIHNNLEIWVQTPTIISNSSGLFMTLQGTTKGLKRFRDEIGRFLPPSIKIRISKDLKADWIAAPQLPTRRKEVMELAVKLGYYSTPRKCTQRELADALGVRQGTIAEHLQSAEGMIIQSWADQAQ